MATNNFLPFCPTDSGSNLLTQGQYAVDTGRDLGNQQGTSAKSRLVNKALRQANAITSSLAQTMSDATSQDFLDDGDSAALTALMKTFFLTLLPSGSLMPFAGSTAPAHFLLCYGQAVSRTTYATLFAAIGTTYGVGDGSTTFNLPDLRGRAIAGKDDMGGAAANRVTTGGSGVNGAALGGSGGLQAVTLATAEIPAHTHTQQPHTHSLPAHSHSINDPGHQHVPVSAGGGASYPAGAANFTFPTASPGQSDFGMRTSIGYTGISLNAAGPVNADTTAVNDNAGGGGSHQNMQPTIVLNYIIKT